MTHGAELKKQVETCFAHVPGSDKLSKKIGKEIQFLAKFKAAEKHASKLKLEHLQCSNLLHLSAMVQALKDSASPSHILKSFTNSAGKKITVDIIAQDGFQWIKVIARSPQALERLAIGDQAYGQRSLMDQAKDYVLATENNLHHFKPPVLVFSFHAGVPERAAAKLATLGVIVKGDVVPMALAEEDDFGSDEENTVDATTHDDHVDYSVLNLDITAMIAYVSALTNGHANHVFQEDILTQQAAWERRRPVKPILEELFRNKQLMTCQSAMDDFQGILQTLGGSGEKARAKELLARIKVVPDCTSDKVQCLKSGGKVRERSKVIFGTGDAMKVVTVSANSGFVRAAQSQNVNLAVINHESRALTEGKMKS